ncbi:MAG: alanine racemase [Bacilli bacterium]
MKYPCVEIDLNKISDNVIKVIKQTSKYGINIAAVTKVISGDVTIMENIVSAGVVEIGDSRLENLKAINHLDVTKLLIRIPMESELCDVVKFCDCSLISEVDTALKISKYAVEQNKIFNLILMTDLGDLREGCFYEEELYMTVEKILELDNVNLIGIGTNWACYGGIMPTDENLSELCRRKSVIEDRYEINLKVVSAGSSNCLHLLDSMPSCINHLRVGSAIFLGIGLNDAAIEGYHHNPFKLKAQIVELKKKPSIPIGKSCLNAFGKEVQFEDKGEIIRAIIAIGRQDIDIEEMIPNDPSVEILGSSSDHIVLQVPNTYKLGDIVSFNITYPGCLKVMTSKYVNKEYKIK